MVVGAVLYAVSWILRIVVVSKLAAVHAQFLDSTDTFHGQNGDLLLCGQYLTADATYLMDRTLLIDGIWRRRRHLRSRGESFFLCAPHEE